MRPCITLPFLLEKDWGGDRLLNYGKNLHSSCVGESWELSAHTNGECTVYGMPLSEAIRLYGQELTGVLAPNAYFPLLIKLIDAKQTLSVQVHPDDDMAMKLYGEHFGKTEAWYILDAPAGAELILGADGSPQDMRNALKDGYMDKLLHRLPVKAGDCMYIPAGTVHAIGKGILLYEVQQSSDRTFRLHAWGRNAQLHIEESLQAMAIPSPHAGKTTPKEFALEGGICQRLVECEAFILDKLEITGIMREATDGSRFYAYTALEAGEMRHAECTLVYSRGDTIFVPANAGEYELEGGTLLKSYIPGGTA